MDSMDFNFGLRVYLPEGGGHVGWTSTPVTFTRLRTYNQPTPPHTHTPDCVRHV